MPVPTMGLSPEELQGEIARRIARLDEAQEEGEHLGAYADLMRMVAVAAYQRAAELIDANNRRLTEQLRNPGSTDADSDA